MYELNSKRMTAYEVKVSDFSIKIHVFVITDCSMWGTWTEGEEIQYAVH